MIASFEVGSVFRIVNEASPTIRKILADVRALRIEIDKTKEALSFIGRPAAMAAATGETEALGRAWGSVAKNAESARLAIGQASVASARAALPAVAAGGGGRARLGGRLGMGGGGGHLGGPGVSIPGGGHINTRGGAMAAIGLGGYAVYEAAQLEDTVYQILYHSGLQYTDANKAKVRAILQESIRTSGFGLHDIGEAATQEIRLFQGTDGTGGGQGLDVLPEMLKAATTEARLKGGNPKEAMGALVGLAHMVKSYDADSVKKLAKDFAFLSIANPSSLESMERAASYAVPILSSGMNIDSMDTLLLGTALARAGVKNSKSGTWLREMAIRAMPGTTIFESEKKAEHHDELLKKIGLLDENGKPTWMGANGNPDVLKMVETAHEGLAKLPLEERVGAERKIFGAQGSGGMAVLADQAVYDQVRNLDAMRKSPEWANRYGTFSQAYLENSTVQQARTAMGEFNNLMANLGTIALPPVNQALKDFKNILGDVDKMVHGTWSERWGALQHALTGKDAGSVGILNQSTERPGDRYERRIEKLEQQKQAPIHLNLNIDGKQLANVVSEQQAQGSQYETNSPAFDGSQFLGP